MSLELRQRIESALGSISLIDPHSHIDPYAPASRNLADLLGYHYYTELIHSAGTPRAVIENKSLTPKEKVHLLVEALHKLDNTVQYAWLIEICQKFFGFTDDRLTLDNWESLYDTSENIMRGAQWPEHVLNQSNVQAVFLTNDFDDPLTGFDTSIYIPCLRTDDLVFHFGKREVRGRLSECTGIDVQSISDLRNALAHRFEHFIQHGGRACAISLPPDFVPTYVPEARALTALTDVLRHGPDANEHQRGALSQFVFWTLAELCHEFGLPFDLMIGVNRNVYPEGVHQGRDLFDSRVSLLQYRELFNSFASVTFPVSVLASSTNQELTSYAWIFPNVVTNGHWWYSNTPTFIERDLAARLEAVPHTKQIAYYSDAYKLEFIAPKFGMYRRVLAKVLANQFVIDRGWSETRAVELGERILRTNVERVFPQPNSPTTIMPFVPASDAIVLEDENLPISQVTESVQDAQVPSGLTDKLNMAAAGIAAGAATLSYHAFAKDSGQELTEDDLPQAEFIIEDSGSDENVFLEADLIDEGVETEPLRMADLDWSDDDGHQTDLPLMIESGIESTTETPVEDLIEAPIDDLVESPMEFLIESPMEVLDVLPKDDLVESPISHLVAAPLEDLIDSPIEGLAKSPTEDLSVPPFEEPIETPISRLVAAPLDDLVEAPISHLVPIEELIKAPIASLVESPVSELVKLPIEDIVQRPTENFLETKIEDLTESPLGKLVEVPKDDLAETELDETSFEIESELDETVFDLESSDEELLRETTVSDVDKLPPLGNLDDSSVNLFESAPKLNIDSASGADDLLLLEPPVQGDDLVEAPAEFEYETDYELQLSTSESRIGLVDSGIDDDADEDDGSHDVLDEEVSPELSETVDFTEQGIKIDQDPHHFPMVGMRTDDDSVSAGFQIGEEFQIGEDDSQLPDVQLIEPIDLSMTVDWGVDGGWVAGRDSTQQIAAPDDSPMNLSPERVAPEEIHGDNGELDTVFELPTEDEPK